MLVAVSWKTEASRRPALQRQRADQLVQGVVPADVLAAEGDLSVAVDIQRRVQCAAVAGQQLGVGDALAQIMEMPFGWQIDWRKWYELR